MMTLAVAHGYKNNIIIKEKISDGITFYTGSMLKETDLNKITIAYSGDYTTGYKNEIVEFSQLNKLLLAKDLHWVVHHLIDGYRDRAHIIAGFNLLALDIDDGNTSLEMVKLLLGNYKYILYTTKRHTNDKPRFRLIFPMSHTLELSADDYKEFMTNVFNWLPITLDDQTSDISRKWQTNTGKFVSNDGELLNVLPFIPKTKMSEKYKQVFNSTQSLNNLQRWFINNSANGNRNNQLARYGFALVDSGLSAIDIQTKVLELNSKLPEPLDELEVMKTVMNTVNKKIQEK